MPIAWWLGFSLLTSTIRRPLPGDSLHLDDRERGSQRPDILGDGARDIHGSRRTIGPRNSLPDSGSTEADSKKTESQNSHDNVWEGANSFPMIHYAEVRSQVEMSGVMGAPAGTRPGWEGRAWKATTEGPTVSTRTALNGRWHRLWSAAGTRSKWEDATRREST